MPQSHYAQVLILLVCFLFFFTSGQLYFDGREVGGGGGRRGRGFLGSHSFQGKWRVDQPKFFQLPSSLPLAKNNDRFSFSLQFFYETFAYTNLRCPWQQFVKHWNSVLKFLQFFFHLQTQPVFEEILGKLREVADPKEIIITILNYYDFLFSI